MGADSLLRFIGEMNAPFHALNAGSFSLFAHQPRTYTNFVLEMVKFVPTSSSPDIGTTTHIRLDHAGDGLLSLWLVFDLPAIVGVGLKWTRYIGFIMLDQIDLKIGTSLVDTLYGLWLCINSELNVDDAKRPGLLELIGYSDELSPNMGVLNLAQTKLAVPLPFYFSVWNGTDVMLPLVSLQRTSTTVTIKMRPASELIIQSSITSVDGDTTKTTVASIKISGGNLQQVEIWGEVVHLDDPEREEFLAESKTYLINEVQSAFDGNAGLAFTAGSTTSPTSFDLDFGHPITVIVFFARDTTLSNTTNQQYMNLTNTTQINGVLGSELITASTLRILSKSVHEEYRAIITGKILPYIHYKRTLRRGIHIIPFGIDLANGGQTTGVLNATKAASMKIDVKFGQATGQFSAYSSGRNVMFIGSGVGGVQYR